MNGAFRARCGGRFPAWIDTPRSIADFGHGHEPGGIHAPLRGAATASILNHRENFERKRTEGARLDTSGIYPEFKIARYASDPKQRWVDGTPEYSFAICGLRKLFPATRFIHLLRDCDSAALSMVHFERVAGTKLVVSLAHAYRHWLKYVRACVAAEEAYGPAIVHRRTFEDLQREPARSMHSLLAFIGEPPSYDCVEPLARKINSSAVSESEAERTEAVAQREEAWRFREELRANGQPAAPSLQAAKDLETQFEQRVDFQLTLNQRNDRLQRANDGLQRELEERTGWALRSNEELEETRRRLLRLQEEFDARTKWALSLNEEVEQLRNPST